jgi:hypothetical protein
MTGSKTLMAITLLISLAASILAMAYVDSHDRLDVAVTAIEHADKRLSQIATQMPQKASDRPTGQ